MPVDLSQLEVAALLREFDVNLSFASPENYGVIDPKHLDKLKFNLLSSILDGDVSLETPGIRNSEHLAKLRSALSSSYPEGYPLDIFRPFLNSSPPLTGESLTLESPIIHYRDTSGGTTLDYPSILFDDGASFCTICLAIARDGNAIAMHEPLIWCYQNEIPVKPNLDVFKFKMDEILGKERVVLITGTNHTHNRDQFTGYTEFLTKYFEGEQMAFLISQSIETSPNTIEALPNTILGLVGYLSGYIFVPRQFTTTGQHECLIINRDGVKWELMNLYFPDLLQTN